MSATRERLWGPSDPVIIGLIGTLMLLGALVVVSASVNPDRAILGDGHWFQSPLRQCVFALAGFVVMCVVSRVRVSLVRWDDAWDGAMHGGLLLLAGAGLAYLLLPISHVADLQRAIVITRSPVLISFQPAEFAKLVCVLWLAALLARPLSDIRRLKWDYLVAMLSLAGIAALMAGKDFGTAALVSVVGFTLLYLAGARWTHLVWTGIVGAALGVMYVLIEPYRIKRVVTFFSEQPDPAGAGYQINQALLAIASGGWWGQGLGSGVQKYGYLPQDNNDFVFAILCEELGIVGGLFTMSIFAVLLLRGWWIASHAADRHARLLATGITLTLCVQAVINLAVVTDCVPTKGISLPFVSAGGSGVLILSVSAGLLSSIGGDVLARKQAELSEMSVNPRGVPA